VLVALGGQRRAVRAPIWGKAFGSLDELLGDPSVDAV
jgi:hypothetical protein